jgi:3-methyladenine DNA glycosylase AlkD
MTRTARALVTDVRAALAGIADPKKAPAMQRYMKSSMPYLGVPTPPLRRTCRAVFAQHPLDAFDEWRDAILTLWRGASHREHRYAAIELASHRRYGALQTGRAIPMYEEMIVDGAWWDYVDTVAHRLGDVLRREPARTAARMRVWARSGNLWKRRTAIICQLGFKSDTDLALLTDCIESSLGSPEFFLQKAIGWALRDLAWSDPKLVANWVRQHRDALSPLSRREALKNIGPLRPR